MNHPSTLTNSLVRYVKLSKHECSACSTVAQGAFGASNCGGVAVIQSHLERLAPKALPITVLLQS